VANDEPARVARTEAVFREVNERIAASAARAGASDAALVCECSDPGCTERLDAPLEEYERVRGDGARFLLAPGHQDARVEQVIAQRPGRTIVQKLGEFAAAARRLDPRTGAT
jgi:hypothetical protein